MMLFTNDQYGYYDIVRDKIIHEIGLYQIPRIN